MFLYLTLGTNDLSRARPFYDAVMAELGYKRTRTEPDEIGYGENADKEPLLWVDTPFDEKPASHGNGSMIAFAAKTRVAVDAFYAAGMTHGGSDEGKPGLRRYGPNFYACYLRDPDGNKISAVCRAAE
jgi:catechol 2,3-dioxygenase-like lactoylglutathione lyase family enzyme